MQKSSHVLKRTKSIPSLRKKETNVSTIKYIFWQEKKRIVGTNRGFWFKQEQQWPEVFPAKQLPENNAGVASASREKSRKKLKKPFGNYQILM